MVTNLFINIRLRRQAELILNKLSTIYFNINLNINYHKPY